MNSDGPFDRADSSIRKLAPSNLNERVQRVETNLKNLFTYEFFSNPFTIFGFVWGIPIPVFFLYFHWSLTSKTVVEILADHKLHWVFMAHPIIFGTFFGVVGKLYMRYHNELEYRARHDELTGLLNHSEFHAITKQCLSKLVPDRDSLSLVMFDLDHFKRVNDSLGHQKGDDVLREVSQLLKEVTRRRDHLSRYGGEEFAVVLPETTRSEAHDVAERIRRTVAADSETIPKWLTLSCGISTFPGDGRTLDELISTADQKLYRAKSEGRNRTIH